MSYRRVQNAQDKWESYCQEHAALVEATHLPKEVFRRADILERFLEYGAFQAGAQRCLISEMPDAAFLTLETFIEPVFDFQNAYPALAEERFRRFKRYG